MAAAAITGDSRISQKQRVQRTGSYRNACRIVDEGEEQILPDVAHRRSREPARTHEAVQIAFEQGDACALHGHIGSRAHGDADVGCCKRGSIIDASPAIATA